MGIFDRFPSTKLNDINLDWILKIISKFKGGNAGQFLRKRSDANFDFYWSSAGGGGTTDYNDLVNQPQINNVTLSGNQSASDLGLLDSAALAWYRTAAAQDVIDAAKQAKITASGMLKGDGDGGVSQAIEGTDYLGPSALNSYRTAAAQDLIDEAQNAASAKADEIAIVITGARPSMVVSTGQYVVVRGSTITGVTDGLYTAVNTLSPSTDVTAADLTAVSVGGLNELKSSFTFGTPQTYITLPYTAPTDGFFFAYATTDDGQNGWVIYQVGSTYLRINMFGGYATMGNIPVRKGDVISLDQAGSNYVSWGRTFYPIGNI